MRRRPARSILFPYTTLFRSAVNVLDEVLVGLLLVVPIAGLLQPVAELAELPVLLQVILSPVYFTILEGRWGASLGKDRKSTRLNSSHANISYAVFCLKKKNI